MSRQYAYSQYIWERPEWPSFTWDAGRLLEPLGSLSRAQGQLTGRMSMLGFSEQDTALRDINDLIAKDMLADSGEGGRSKNYILSGV